MVPVLEAASGAAHDARVVRLQPDEAGAVGYDAVPERAGEVLAVADGPELRVADAARGDEDVLGPEGEVLRGDDEAVLLRLEAGDGAVGDDRRLAVAQDVAEGVDDRRGLAVGREHARVGHAAEGHVEGPEALDDPARASIILIDIQIKHPLERMR